MNSSSPKLSDALAGKRVLLPIDRKSEEMAESLERHGAAVTIAAPMRITAVTDDPTLHEQCQQLASEAIDYTVVTTGAGFRALMSLADQKNTALSGVRTCSLNSTVPPLLPVAPSLRAPCSKLA